MNRKNGFTLIELIVVITIMAILTGITMGQFSLSQKKARDVARKSDLNGVYKALLAYYADYGKFPDKNSVDVSNKIDINNLMIGNSEFKSADGYIYMKTMPKENKLTTKFCYKSIGDKKFVLVSKLENNMDSDFNKLMIGSSGYVIDRSGSLCVGVSNVGYNFALISPNANILEFTEP